MNFFTATMLLFGFSACETDRIGGPMDTPNDDDLLNLPCSPRQLIDRNNLPASALTHIANNFPNASIERAYEFQLPGNIRVFGARLSNDTEILFDINGEFLSSGNRNTATINFANLPGIAVQYLNANHPNWMNQVVRIEANLYFGQPHIAVNFSNGSGVVFDSAGGWRCSANRGRNDDDCDDDDDDDRDDHDDDDCDDGDDDDDCRRADLIQVVKPWLDANIGAYQIKDIECEEFCDEELQIEVELNNVSAEYYFDMTGNFLYTRVERGINVIPQAVINAVASLYPNFRFDDDETDVLTFANGTVAYEFEIEVDDDDDDIELIVDATGNILCIEED